MSKRFEVTFKDTFKFEDIEDVEQAADALLRYLEECVREGDVTAFEIQEIS